MFEQIQAAPPDAILGLTDAFQQDPNPNKINLGVGVYKDSTGNTPILPSVKEAESKLVQAEHSKSYLPIDGLASYNTLVQELLFGSEHEILQSGRAATSAAPGGTGALRMAADTLARLMPNTTVWVSTPTWPNHPNVFQAAGLAVKSYPYFDPNTHGLDFGAMLAAVREIPQGDIIVLHGCCHNPTGADLSLEQWQTLGDLLHARGILPLVDFAYQGFAEGLREDAAGWLSLCRPDSELMIANSFSKNFGLYNERVGALTIIAGTASAAQAMLSHVKSAVRANFSNPPFHGAAIVSTILGDQALRVQWEEEVTGMRTRIHRMRDLFVETLNEKGVQRDFSYITRQRGMFSFSGLTPEQVKLLRDEYAVYIVGSGRINVAGMSENQMDYLCTAIADVLQRTPVAG